MGTREDLLGEYKDRLGQGVGPIGISFFNVAQQFKQASLISQMDEESVTSAFLGGVTSSFPLCAYVFGSQSNEVVNCSWGQFRKSSRGADDHDSEAYRGADFALVVWLSDEYARVAIFQAKKTDEGVRSTSGERVVTPFLNIHRRPPLKDKLLKDWREAQMVRLVRTGHEAIAAEECRTRAGDRKMSWAEAAHAHVQEKDFVEKNGAALLRHLHWVHYLGYLDDDAVCVPLSSIPEEAFSRELENEEFSVNKIEIKKDMKGLRTFVDVLLDGVALGRSEVEPKVCPKGWKLMHAEVLKSILPKLQSMMVVYAADDRGTKGLELMKEASAENSFDGLVQQVSPAPDNAPGDRPRSTPRMG